jgi:hypothetical protein
MRVPDVELLWWDGCPSTERALADLRDAFGELGLDPASIKMREMKSDTDAAAAKFIGSPTILIDGEDVDPPPIGEQTGLNCRIYKMPDGRISPTPDPNDVRAALARAVNAP